MLAVDCGHLTRQLGHHVAKLGKGLATLRRRPVPTQDPAVDHLVAPGEHPLVFQPVQQRVQRPR